MFIRTNPKLKRFEIECENYEDIFEEIETQIHIQKLVLVIQEISNYSANKLIFDLAQAKIIVDSISLCGGGFSDQIIKKLPQIFSK